MTNIEANGVVHMEQKITRSEIQKALEVIESSVRFKKSAKAKALLHYVVEQYNEGREDQIKAYTIGVDALGKQEDYDPQTDPTVRVLASRLRSMLELYYGDEGINDPIIITIPSGGYKPEFTRNSATITVEPVQEPVPEGNWVERFLPNVNRWAFIALAVLSSIWLYRSSDEGTSIASTDQSVAVDSSLRILVRPIISEVKNAELEILPHRLYFNLLEAFSNNDKIMPVIAPGSIATIQQFMASNTSLPGPSHMLLGEVVSYGKQLNFTVKLVEFPSMDLVAIKSYPFDEASQNMKLITDEISDLALQHRSSIKQAP